MEKGALRDPEGFRGALGDWFVREGRDYPWRRRRDAWGILVSEVMLQQTQIATVLGRGYYTRFLEVFPDPSACALAEDGPLLKAWEGLGYYRRARMLRETARAVVARGGFPEEVEELMGLPGVGRYTAGALRAFAFDLPAVLVDGNVARVLARVMDFREEVDGPAGLKQVWGWAEELADGVRPRIYHAALMELGQRICRPGVPDCMGCPVARFCKTREPERLPVKRAKVAVTEVVEHALWVRDGRGRVLLHREGGKRREGLWKLPTREEGEVGVLKVVHESRYSITRYRVALRVYGGRRVKAREGEEWHEVEGVGDLAMASPFRRVVEFLLENGV
jgi:A/G-specific adenine glycosylase